MMHEHVWVREWVANGTSAWENAGWETPITCLICGIFKPTDDEEEALHDLETTIQ